MRTWREGLFLLQQGQEFTDASLMIFLHHHSAYPIMHFCLIENKVVNSPPERRDRKQQRVIDGVRRQGSIDIFQEPQSFLHALPTEALSWKA